MRLIKMLGLALVAAIAVTAFVGAGSASAMLCKVQESPCKAANEYPAHTTILALSTATFLKAPFGSLLCDSHITLLHEGLSLGKLIGTITFLSWSSCKGCTPVETTSSGPIGKFLDEVTSLGNGRILPENVTILMKNCALGAECTLKTTNGTTVLSLTGGTIGAAGTATFTAKTTVSLSGFGCGSTGEWETESPYHVTEVNGSTTGSIFIE